MNGFKLSSTKPIAELEDEGIDVHIRDVIGEPLYFGEGESKTPVTIKVAGTYSKTYRRASEVQRDKMIKHRRSALNGEQLARQQLELTASCVLNWAGFLDDSDNPIRCTKENVIAVLDGAPWVREAVEEAMGDHELFSKTASRN